MPRKFYAAKNRYCRNANISEDVFLRVLWMYLQTAPAHYAKQQIENDSRIEGRAPSTKTISRYYQLIGEYIFDRTIAKMLEKIDSRLASVRREDYRSFSEFTKEFGDNWANHSLEKVRYAEYLIISEGKHSAAFYDDYLIELRKISAARRGLRGNRHGDMALACLRSMISSTEDGYNPEGVSPSYVKSMRIFLSVKQWMEADPL